MSNLKLQKDELELLASYEAEEWKSAKKLKEQKEQYKHMRVPPSAKTSASIFAFQRRDLLDLQKRAIRQGIPYQTLLSSVLHKYASGSLTEK